MKKSLTTLGLVALAVSGLAYALQHQITPLPVSDTTCDNLKGTWQFIANWEPLFDATKPPDPTTKKRPFLIDPKTGKPWSTYRVALRVPAGYLSCSVPNNGMVDCGGATKCSVLVTCPTVRNSGTAVSVIGTGVPSSWRPTSGGRKPANC
jgi:hypothetical protein